MIIEALNLNSTETERHLPDPSSPELKPSPPPFWFCWPGETHSALEVSLWTLGVKVRDRWKAHREFCMQAKRTEILKSKDRGAVSSCEELESD